MYKVGDRVRIVETWPIRIRHYSKCIDLDKWRGRVMTIRAAYSNVGIYRMIEDIGEHGDAGGWFWYADMIAGYAEQEDLDANEIDDTPTDELVSFFSSIRIYEGDVV